MSMVKSAQELIDFIEDAGFAWREYSGRGIYGEECVGVELDGTLDLWVLAQSLLNVPPPTIDSMGQGIIAYWPKFILEEARR